MTTTSEKDLLKTDEATIIVALPPGKNKGELDEIKCKKEFYEKRNDIDYCVALFGDDAQEGIAVINAITGLPYEDLNEISKKTKSTSKSDVTIRFNKTQELIHISIKSKRGSMPSILNHTPRSAKVFQTGGSLNNELANLDILAKEYHDKRQHGFISEDVEICKLNSYTNEDIYKSLVNLLIYFIFIGSGSQHSKQESNAILLINKDGSKKYIPCLTAEEKESYVKTISGKCIMSYRKKGMRKNTQEQDLPWVFRYNNKDCGAIHIRLAH